MDTSVDRQVTFRVDFEWKIGVATASGHHKIARKSDVDVGFFKNYRNKKIF